ncbi:hypothetical protein MGN01_21020 [Methylobacterium gnaphalii]|uniref:Uncharacterized protein n=1 Tax=Methylobacterium gnaphalii TaxID=1010610 RepID=A0A512JJX2_9HYPH|nr:hypothetical protein MGN01_21020 [Methylobacterium gnaphalii]GLS50555.1 hypothetical protein GCM10007885_34070 [Methylobacterium gnaphalii]
MVGTAMPNDRRDLQLQACYRFSDAEAYTRLGQVGDFFGGVLNPLLTFLTFIGVLATIFLQREELKETREEVS